MPKRSSKRTTDARSSVSSGRDAWTSSELFPDYNFPFSISHDTPQQPDGFHTHKGFWELVVVCSGEGLHCTETEEFMVGAGDVFVIKGEQRHGYKAPRDLFLKNICFSPKVILIQTKYVEKLMGYHALFTLEPKLRRAHRFESRLRLRPEETAHAMSLIALMEKELKDEVAGYEYTVIALFMQTVSFLCRRYANFSSTSTRSLMQMAKVISYLETHYADPIRLTDIEELAHMSSSALLRLFKEATGFSPVDYLIHVRISRAIELFRDYERTITEAAFSVGFIDSNYFARQFKRIMKMSPSQYRALMQPLI
jgi:AraC-like DNA-binding protein/mannose-6-phosphate isomerase-like protein (cupin superfamily)